MACKFIILLAAVAVAKGAVLQIAQPVAAAVPVAVKAEEYDAVPQYSFAYDVQDALTGDSKAQYESRNGDIVQGSYSLIEADGSRRIVDYTADPVNGFNAVVRREPLTAVAGPAVIAAPVAPVRPVGVAPAAGGPAPPQIPSSGPDSDVEVLDARSGPLGQQGEQREQREQQEEERPERLRAAQASARAAPVQQQRQQQQQQQQRVVAAQVPVRAVAAPLAAPAATSSVYQQFVSSPAAFALTYPSYTAAYTAPVAYSAPVSGFTYTTTVV